MVQVERAYSGAVESRMIALCAKCYYVDEQDSEKKTFSTKGRSKRQISNTWKRFQAALKDSIDRAGNTGLRLVYPGVAKRTATYEQQKLGAARWGSHRENRVSHDLSRRKLCISYFTGQPTALRGQCLVSDHCANNTQQARPALSQLFQACRLLKIRLDLSSF